MEPKQVIPNMRIQKGITPILSGSNNIGGDEIKTETSTDEKEKTRQKSMQMHGTS